MTNKRRKKKPTMSLSGLLDLHTHLQYASALITRDGKSSGGIHSSARKMLHHFMMTVKGADKHIGPKPLICVHSARNREDLRWYFHLNKSIRWLLKPYGRGHGHPGGGRSCQARNISQDKSDLSEQLCIDFQWPFPLIGPVDSNHTRVNNSGL